MWESGWSRRRKTRWRDRLLKRGRGERKKHLNLERLLTLIFRPSEVPEETVEEANLEVRPGTIPHGYEVGSFMIKVYDKSLPLISRFDKKKARVASATLSICSLDLPGRRSNVLTRRSLTLFLQVHCKGPERSSLLLRGEWERVLLESSQCGPFHPSEITRFC